MIRPFLNYLQQSILFVLITHFQLQICVSLLKQSFWPFFFAAGLSKERRAICMFPFVVRTYVLPSLPLPSKKRDYVISSLPLPSKKSSWLTYSSIYSSVQLPKDAPRGALNLQNSSSIPPAGLQEGVTTLNTVLTPSARKLTLLPAPFLPPTQGTSADNQDRNSTATGFSIKCEDTE